MPVAAQDPGPTGPEGVPTTPDGQPQQEDQDDEELGEEIPEEEDEETEPPADPKPPPPARQRQEPPAPAQPRARPLPRTGFEAGWLLAAGMFTLGGGLVLWSRLPIAQSAASGRSRSAPVETRKFVSL
jgi:LPXTG-motif cell wall-anchored protein